MYYDNTMSTVKDSPQTDNVTNNVQTESEPKPAAGITSSNQTAGTYKDDKVTEIAPTVIRDIDDKNVETYELGPLTEQAMSEFFDNKYDKSRILPISIEAIDPMMEESVTDPIEQAHVRQQLLSRIHHAMNDRKKLTETNDKLQKKLVQYYRHKRSNAAMKMQKLLQQNDTTIVDIDQRYAKYQKTISQFQNELANSEQEIQRYIEIRTRDRKERNETIELQISEFVSYRHQIALTAANSHTGKKISLHEWESMIASEKKKDMIVQSGRLDNIKLLNKVQKLRATIISKECVGTKLSLVDFEQIKVENQSYNEKLADGSDVSRRLNGKICNNIHILTHMKEKIVFMTTLVQREMENETDKLIVSNARKSLTKVKKTRDDFVMSNEKLLHIGGLLNNRMLLKHYENTVDKVTDQTQRMSNMTESMTTMKNRITEFQWRSPLSSSTN